VRPRRVLRSRVDPVRPADFNTEVAQVVLGAVEQVGQVVRFEWDAEGKRSTQVAERFPVGAVGELLEGPPQLRVGDPGFLGCDQARRIGSVEEAGRGGGAAVRFE
jgi:hypothetical protein